MIRPKRLKRGDKIAIVSLSWGGLGDDAFIHKYHIAKSRLEKDFGLVVVPMPHALKGSEFVKAHPELRAKDLMDALKDPDIKGIFSAIGGDDTIRLLPYIDYEVIRDNPKVFMGYSDTTANHLMFYKAGVISFYGPSVMCEFGEYVHMYDYTKKAVKDLLFESTKDYSVPHAYKKTDEHLPWAEDRQTIERVLEDDPIGYEFLQGTQRVEGHLMMGCLDALMLYNGTSIWPSLDQWEGAILCLETSEDQPEPDMVKWVLRNLAAQGILKAINGLVFSRPMQGKYYDAYKSAILDIVLVEEGLSQMPILYNANFGHAAPMGCLPYGVRAELDPVSKTLKLLEDATIE